MPPEALRELATFIEAWWAASKEQQWTKDQAVSTLVAFLRDIADRKDR